jgi:signal transduction histidine kinase
MDPAPVEQSDTGQPFLVRVTRHRYTARQLLAVDAFVVAAIGVTSATVVDQYPNVSGAGWDTTLWCVGAAAAAAVLFRRRFPRAVLAVVGGATILFLSTGLVLPTSLYLLLALYSFVAASNQAESLVVTLFTVVVVAATVVAAGGSHDLPASVDAINQICLAGVAWFAGESAKNAREYRRVQRDRAAEAEVAAAEARTAEIRRALAEERTTIARELHDVVAHAMSIVTVRAGVGRMVIDSQPDQAREALEIIEATSRRSLQEMRLLVGVLRRADEHEAELAPAPGLANLSQLVDDIASAGVRTDVRMEGNSRALPPSADLTAYRIVQEALTNVVRHAGTTRAVVTLAYRPDELAIEVTDEGPGPGGPSPHRPPAGGHGLIGMQERVGLFDGSLEHGPHGHGYRVRAVLPIRDLDPAELGGLR